MTQATTDPEVHPSSKRAFLNDFWLGFCDWSVAEEGLQVLDNAPPAQRAKYLAWVANGRQPSYVHPAGPTVEATEEETDAAIDYLKGKRADW